MKEQLEKAQQTAELLEQDLRDLIAAIEKTENKLDPWTIHYWMTYTRLIKKDLAELG